MNLLKKIFLIFGFFMIFNSQASANNYKNPDYNPAKKHHLIDGFMNRYLPEMPQGSFLKWQAEKLTKGFPKKTPAEFRQQISAKKPDLNFIQNNRDETAATWIGHSTILLQIDGLNILTDPQFSDRASPIGFLGPKRFAPLNINIADLPHIDAVLISHNHYDHLDLATVQKLIKQKNGAPKFFVPLGVQYWFLKNVEGAILQGEKQNIFAMDWNDSYEILGKTTPVKIEFLAVQHWSARSTTDRNETLWGSFAVLSSKFRFWFSGDLGYSKDISDIADRLKKLDLAAIAIGGYEPRWFMKNYHLNPQEAVKIMEELNAKKAIAIHFGTFMNLTDETLDQPIADLKTALDEAGIEHERFLIPLLGESFRKF
jgi:L-ascorbate metabolism protein UlaG (beta-lactamase superfamily)